MNNHNPTKYNDLIGDMLKSDDHQGRVDHLEGAGKPLPEEYFSGDTFQHFQRIAKDAGYKPYWLKLQHEIREELQELATKQNNLEHKELIKSVKSINKKVTTYNKNCPPPFLKGKISADKIDQALNYW